MSRASEFTHNNLTRQSARVRLVAWIGASIYLITFVAAFLLLPEQSTRATFIAAIFPLPAGAALLAAFLATRSSAGKRFRLWRLLAVSMSLFLLGLSYRSLVVITEGRFPRSGSFEDVVFVLGLVVLIPVVLLITEPFEVVGLRKLRATLDLISMLIAVWSISLIVLFSTSPGTESGTSVGSTMLFALYPVMAFALTLYLVVFKRTSWRSSDALVLAALAIFAIGVTVAVAYIGSYIPGTAHAARADLLISASLLLFALAGVHVYTQRERVSTRPAPEADLPQWPGLLSLGLALVGIPALILASARIDDLLVRIVLSLAVSAFAVAVVARSAVVTYENRRLAQQSIWDPLTGVFNNRYFRARVDEEVAEARLLGTDLSVCIANIDAFDSFNSEFGYRAGDIRLQDVARLFDEARAGGLAFRIGGDDFALLLPGRGVMEAHEIATRIAMRAGALGGGSMPGVNLSVGIAVLPEHASDAESLIRYASGSQYWATSLGGNRIVVFDPNVVDALDSKEHLTMLEEESHLRLVESLAAAVDARDPDTRYHSANVAKLAQGLGEALGLTDEHVRLIYSAAQLHDVGKIGIPDSILLKPGRLDEAERMKIEEHPSLGTRILQASTRPEMLQWIESHHERWDGKGYPAGTVGPDIPLEGRVLAICDAYDAMTSDRPYKRAMTVAETVDEMRRCAGTQFDPDLVETFIDVLIGTWPTTHTSNKGI